MKIKFNATIYKETLEIYFLFNFRSQVILLQSSIIWGYLVHFLSPGTITKNNLPKENFLHSGKMKLSNSNIKIFLILSQKNAVLIFQETESPQKFLIFQETELSYISGNENHKRLLIFLVTKVCKLENENNPL